MIESLIVDAWLATVLGGDATLLAAAPGGVHADVAPEGTASPWVVWFQVAGEDTRGMGAARIMADLLYEVRVTGRNCGYGALKAAANRVDALLHQAATTTNADGTIIGCLREDTVRFSEQDGETIYRHLGGTFRVLAQA
jgi:hypothetical protein